MQHGKQLFLGLIACLIIGCAQEPTINKPVDWRNPLPPYETIEFQLISPRTHQAEVTHQTRGDGAKEGWKMMAAAPIGCLQGGVFAGICLAAAPFFPILAANNVQDLSVSEQELERVAKDILDFNLEQKLNERFTQQIHQEQLAPYQPKISDPSRKLLMRLTLAPMQLKHSGYKNGDLDVSMPYEISLIDAQKRTLAQTHGEGWLRVRHSEWEKSGTLPMFLRLESWIDKIAQKSFRDTLLDWQPNIALQPISPAAIPKRSILGFRYEEPPEVETESLAFSWSDISSLLPSETTEEVEALSYELTLYVTVGGDEYWNYRSRPIVQIQGLSEPHFVLKQKLLPCTRYRWTARVRFLHQGRLFTSSTPKHHPFNTKGTDCKTPRWSINQEEYEAYLKQ